MAGARERTIAALRAHGFLAPEAEADALLEAARRDEAELEDLVARRTQGEPLAWVTGWVDFCGLRLSISPGIFVPRPHTEALARRAAELLSSGGVAVDLCTGCGAVAAVLAAQHPRATVLATDIDPAAVACAQRNGIDALQGDLDAPLPPSLRGRVDVITAVVPYVPTEELHLLPRDVIAHEPPTVLDGGPRGTGVLRRVVHAAPSWLRRRGRLLLELGGDQATELTPVLTDVGFSEVQVHPDEEGQLRFVEATRTRWER